MSKKTMLGIFSKFAASYAAVLLIVMIVQIVFSTIMIDAFEKRSVTILETAVQNELEKIDGALLHIEDTARSISQNDVLREFFRGDSPDSFKYNDIAAFKKTLASYNTGNPYIDNICIQNEIADMIIDLDAVFGRALWFYHTKITSPNMSAEELYKNSLDASGYDAEGICRFQDGGNSLPFVVHLSAYKQKNSSVIIYISLDKILEGVNNLILEKDGIVSFSNEKDAFLVSKGQADSKKEKNYYSFSGELEKSLWKYDLKLPKSFVFEDVAFYRNLSVLFSILSMILGFFVCFYVVMRDSRAYVELLEIIGIRKESIPFKKNVLKEIIPHVEKMKKENNDKFYIGRQSTLRKLLFGTLSYSAEIEEAIKTYELPLNGPDFGVVIMSCTKFDDGEIYNRKFMEFISHKTETIFPDACTYFDNPNNIVLLFSIDSKEDFCEQVKLMVARLKCDVFLPNNVFVSFAVGSMRESLSDISTSYKEACDTERYMLLTEVKDLLFYSDIPSDEESYYYSIEIENELIEKALQSDLKGVELVLKKIQKENFVKRKLSLNNIDDLFGEIRASIKKICNTRSIHYEFLVPDGSARRFFEYTMNFFYIICSDSAMQERPNRSLLLCQKIQEFIKNNYHVKDISLNYLAQEFEINPYYLSGMFKKQTGESFFAYLEKIRLDKASQLLREEHITVAEAAERTGFSSEGTFRRSFKRSYGVTPQEWLKSKK